jgi:hypothetical protein
MDRATTTISPVPPYDFELTAAFQSRYGLDSMEGGTYPAGCWITAISWCSLPPGRWGR